jgi:5-methylthioadenosine/S-adenosylhomocysteine deaminase
MQSVDSVIHARWIAPVEPAGILENHALVVDAGRIVAVVPSAQADARFAGRERIVRGTHLLLPGLVNAEVDLAATLWRGSALTDPRRFDGAPAGAAADAIGDSVALGLTESLLGGITTSATIGRHPGATAATAAALGCRLVLVLPVDGDAGLGDQAFAAALALHDEYRDHPLVHSAFALLAPAAASAAQLTRLRIVADQLERPLLIESAGADVRALRAAGLWHPGTVLLGYAALGADAATPGTIAVVHRPAADLRHGIAPAPVAALSANGITIALGTGRFPLGRNILDTVALSARLAGLEAGAPPLRAATLLRMATLGGALALGIEDRVGTLAAGKRADAVAVDLSSAAVVPIHDPLAALVEVPGAGGVSDVWIGGRSIVAERRLLVADADDLIERAAHRRTMLLSSDPLPGRE